jgi:hypothetical protein
MLAADFLLVRLTDALVVIAGQLTHLELLPLRTRNAANNCNRVNPLLDFGLLNAWINVYLDSENLRLLRLNLSQTALEYYGMPLPASVGGKVKP